MEQINLTEVQQQALSREARALENRLRFVSSATAELASINEKLKNPKLSFFAKVKLMGTGKAISKMVLGLPPLPSLVTEDGKIKQQEI